MFLTILIPILILLPNLLLIIFPPTNIPKRDRNRSRAELLLILLEKLGQILVFIIPLFLQVHMDSLGSRFYLFFMAVALLLYYACWLRFFLAGRDFSFFYKPFWNIPLPLALCPIVYFLFSAAIMDSLLMLAASVLFGFAHLMISRNKN